MPPKIRELIAELASQRRQARPMPDQSAAVIERSSWRRLVSRAEEGQHASPRPVVALHAIQVGGTKLLQPQGVEVVLEVVELDLRRETARADSRIASSRC